MLEQAIAGRVTAAHATTERALLDESAFEALYKSSARPLLAYLNRVSGNQALADDIFQRAFLQMLRTPLPPLEDEQLRAYLFRIATNLLTDEWRKSRREVYDVPERAGRALDGVDMKLDMKRIFSELKPQERALLWLAHVEGAEHREIAGALRVQEKSVKVLLFRARKRLAALLTRNGIGGGTKR